MGTNKKYIKSLIYSLLGVIFRNKYDKIKHDIVDFFSHKGDYDLHVHSEDYAICE